MKTPGPGCGSIAPHRERKRSGGRDAFGTGPSLYLRDPDGYRIELKPR